MIRRLKTVLLLSALAGLLFGLSSVNAQSPEVKWGYFFQSTAVSNEADSRVIFGLDKAWIIVKGSVNQYVEFTFQADLTKLPVKKAKDGKTLEMNLDKDGDTPAYTKDVVVIIKPFSHYLNISIGKFKTPIGYEFSLPSYKLDMIKTTYTFAMIFERNPGIMLSGKKITRFNLGYAAGVFNYGPAGATEIGNNADGANYTYCGRLSAEPLANLYGEVYYGLATTNVDSQSAVSVVGAAVSLNLIKKLKISAEYMDRDDKNTKHNAAYGATYYLQTSYLVHPHFEPALRFEEINVKYKKESLKAQDQTNWTVGLNYYFNPEDIHKAKILVNYVASSLKNADAVQFMLQLYIL
jgi:hypothetical protein